MNAHYLIREYKTADFDEILRIFDQNSPKDFHPSERSGLESYLQNEREKYFVIEVNQSIIGAGGINFSQDKHVAIISWDLINPSYHGKGFGRKLLEYRLDFIRSINEVKSISVRTSQFSDTFYAKSGFIEIGRKKDYWAPGFDLVEMTLDL